MDNKLMFCLFALVAITSLVIGDLTCYEGTVTLTAVSSFNCSTFGLKNVQCEECYSQGKIGMIDIASVGVTYGCKQEGMVNFTSENQYTFVCIKDFCNCFY